MPYVLEVIFQSMQVILRMLWVYDSRDQIPRIHSEYEKLFQGLEYDFSQSHVPVTAAL